jgi:hypothetical protein
MFQRIVGGKLYDLFSSQLMFKVTLVTGNYKARWIDVYQTSGGRYFKMDGWWGCAGSQVIEPIGFDEVLELCERTGDAVMFSKLSGRNVEAA